MPPLKTEHIINFPMTLILTISIIFFSCSSVREKDEADIFVEQLLQQMTLQEKVGQMTQIAISEILNEESREGFNQSGLLNIDLELLEHFVSDHHVGSFLNGYAVSSETWYQFSRELQEYNRKHHRLDIPIIFGIDHIHGATYLGNATIFPQAISLAASFNPELSRIMAKVTVLESRHLGHHWNFNPVLDIARNKFWPRMHETFGEDPHLIAKMGEAYVKGIQETEVAPGVFMAATAKHFLGYSDPRTGRDRSPAILSDQKLHEVHRPPFQAAIDAGVKTVMVNSGEINGVPVHASYDLLTGLLRDEMGFEGVIITDWKDIISLHRYHRVAPTEKEAVYQAIMAGVDVSMVPYSTTFCDYLVELVEEGRIPESRIDESVKRILRLKYDLGLFDQPFPENKDETGLSDHHELAREATRESIVLIKNEQDILPLQSNSVIVLAGSTENMKRSLTGGWTYIWQHLDDDAFPNEMLTIREALQNRFGHNRVRIAQENTIRGLAAGADAIIIATGEPSALSEGFNNITDLDLPSSDRRLMDIALQTGTPVIVLLTQGRPRTFPEQADKVDAILHAGLPGYFGAEIIAEILAGDVNPSGKLPFTYPWHQSFQLNYNHKHTDFTFLHENDPETERYSIANFGEGLSYTHFAYSDLSLSDTILRSTHSSITASVEVTNMGERAGKETVLWFIRQEYGTITRPVKALKHFEKRHLEPGEYKKFNLEILPVEHLGYPDKNGNILIEPGVYTLIVNGQELPFVFSPS